MKWTIRSVLVAAIGMACSASPDLFAQDLEYTRISTTEAGGLFGVASSLMGSAGDEDLEEVTRISGTRMRTDTGDDSVILDFATGGVVMVNHPTRSYQRFDLEDFLAFTQERAQAAESAPNQTMPGGAEGVEYEVSVSTDRTGIEAELLGYSADQILVTIESKPTRASDPDGRASSMALVTELWLSDEFPAARALDELMSQAPTTMGRSFTIARSSGSAARMVGMNGQIQVAMDRTQEQLAELGALPLKQTMSFVHVPPGQELDLAAVLDFDEEGGGMEGLMTAAMGGASREDMQERLARMGLPTGGEGEQAGEAGVPAVQATLLRVVEEVTDFELTELDDEIFEPPTGYTERAMGGE